MDVAVPPLVSISEGAIEVLPCGVVKIKNVVTPEAQQRLWDAVMCGGFDYRAVVGDVNQGANMWYTKTPGAPDILLHYNYYEPPLGTKPKGLKRSATGAAAQEQPPPMAVLSMADAIFKALREDGLGRTVVAQGESSDDDDDDDDDDDEPQQAAAGSAQAGGAIASEGSSAATDAGTSSEGGETSGAANEASISGGGAPGGAGCDGLAGKKRSAPAKEVKKEHRDIGIDEDPLVAIVRQAEEDNMRLQWPRRPNFRSVLAIGYRDTDSFRWHTDLAGDEGWVCSISVGAKAIFEYLPTAAPSALRRARAKAAEDTVRVEIDSGDAVLFNGGLLPHRVASVQPVAEPGEGADPALQAMMAPYVRLNLQVRVYGAGESFGLHQLLRRGYDYIR